jgi:hypothetical protein
MIVVLEHFSMRRAGSNLAHFLSGCVVGFVIGLIVIEYVR